MSLLAGVDLHPQNVEEALGSLDTVVARLAARGDARAVFPDVYGIITRNVAHEVGRPGGLFLEPRWISRLAGRFAERYLETLAWSLEGDGQDCTAWELAYGLAHRNLTVPLQDATLGISAHINFDLALGLWRTIEEFGDTSQARLARYKHDHDAVNVLLAKSLPESLSRLVERYGCSTTSVLGGWGLQPMTGALALHLLGRWREQVWRDVLALIQARSDRERASIIVQMHHRSSRLGQFLSLASRARSVGRSVLTALPWLPLLGARHLARHPPPHTRVEQAEDPQVPLAG